MNGVFYNVVYIVVNEYDGKVECVFFYFNVDWEYFVYSGCMQ